jgi:hypothetical protein
MVRPGGNQSFGQVIEDAFGFLDSKDAVRVEILEDYSKALELAKQPYPRRIERVISLDQERMQRFQKVISSGGFGGPFQSTGIPDAFWADAAFTANLHLIETALALELYVRKHKRVPETLLSLVPEFLPSVPIDPYNGEALSIFRRSNEILIVSVGTDEANDTVLQAAGPPNAARTGTDLVFTFR